jgi:large subunit GTPase 1
MGNKKQSKKSNSSLGKQLIKKHKLGTHLVESKGNAQPAVFKYTTEIDDKPNLKSVMEPSSLDEFVSLAHMSNQKFEAERNVHEVSHTNVVIKSGQTGTLSAMLSKEQDAAKNPKYVPLKIPRRPKWSKDMTAFEINQNEQTSFLEWRRDIAGIEENNVRLSITPFEKNLEVWRQLWRVIERSDLLLQIVDARNPYFFYSRDLERYIKEVNKTKRFLLVINKADYLSEELREHWSQYFKDQDVDHVFFSAIWEQEKIDKEAEEEEALREQEEESEGSDAEEAEQEQEEGKAEEGADKAETDKKEPEEDAKPEVFEKAEKTHKEQELDEIKTKGQDLMKYMRSSKIFSKDELLDMLKFGAFMKGCDEEKKLTVGMVGYPNVGKSSIINVLCGQKKVGVAAMPGKTKHFQTLVIDPTIMLCDCPGLVFPSFTNSKSEMICCGVLPIDQMRDYVSPVDLVIQRLPKEVLESFYKIKLPAIESKNYTSRTLLATYAGSKGLVTAASSNPNQSVASRVVLKDYVNGRLCFVNLRPDFDPAKHGDAPNQVMSKVVTTAAVIPEEAEEEESKRELSVEAANVEGDSDDDEDDEDDSDDSEDDEEGEAEQSEPVVAKEEPASVDGSKEPAKE